ncbi:hypothetical protein MWN34_10930 [Ancylobacter sp. 6x-1]|uniref:Mobilization protein n=1 Tax=Ancylobacter crimeensis TaxID=2579147 RepID=A0ABT0DBS9_9HYPH|nr:hypothetical protein [Ancylobacter crimeensis]MCK0197427.1 hypothetical protein [Ancylobacter crimeensis]
MKKPIHLRGHAAAPISLRLTPEERHQLECDAAGRSLSAYIRSRLFGADTKAETTSQTSGRLGPAERQKLLAQILAKLGASKALPSLNELADAARIGVLPLTPDVLADIRGACLDIAEIRDGLLRGLGLRPADGGAR